MLILIIQVCIVPSVVENCSLVLVKKVFFQFPVFIQFLSPIGNIFGPSFEEKFESP